MGPRPRSLARGATGEPRGSDQTTGSPRPVRGDLGALAEVAELLGREPLPDAAGAFHDAVARILERAGWDCLREVEVANRGDGRKGRVDLLAVRGGTWLAVEMDRRTPRAKSVRKLLQVSADVRAVVLRRAGVGVFRRPDGIYVLGAPVRPP